MTYTYSNRKLTVYSDAFAVIVDVDGQTYSSVLENGQMFVYNVDEPTAVNVVEYTEEEWLALQNPVEENPE